jgi:hypothetical protein
VWAGDVDEVVIVSNRRHDSEDGNSESSLTLNSMPEVMSCRVAIVVAGILLAVRAMAVSEHRPPWSSGGRRRAGGPPFALLSAFAFGFANVEPDTPPGELLRAQMISKVSKT